MFNKLKRKAFTLIELLVVIAIIGTLVGTWSELYELMELANKGLVKLSMQEYKLDQANKALHDLNNGQVKGRAVLVP